jgi:hypothetical protein
MRTGAVVLVRLLLLVRAVVRQQSAGPFGEGSAAQPNAVALTQPTRTR